jgi:catechol 2,3-dioxygenase-like lactoylglutathione lyase family enzyme
LFALPLPTWRNQPCPRDPFGDGRTARRSERHKIDVWFAATPESAAVWETLEEADTDCRVFDRCTIQMQPSNGKPFTCRRFKSEERSPAEFVVFCEGPFVLEVAANGETECRAKLESPMCIVVMQLNEGARKTGGESWGFWNLQSPPLSFVTRDRIRAAAFYRDTLGLTAVFEDNFAAVFKTGGVTLRVSVVPDFTPHEHTILGFSVPDVAATVKALLEKGVTFNVYKNFNQDDLGIWTAPGGIVRVAWFKDPDGNVLSVTNA